MNRYKLIAIDLDDTLLNSQLKISPRSKALIQQLRAQGVVVTLSTGRMFLSSRPIAMELALDIPLITYQGALVKNCLSGETLIHRTLAIEYSREIINIAREKQFHLNLYLEDQLYMEELSPEGEAYARLAGVPVCLVPDLTLLTGEPTKLLLIGEETSLDQLQAVLKPHFAGTVHITKSKPYFLEFTHPLANKGDALAELAKHYGIAQEETMAIGDSFNDLEMLAYAGLGVAMGNARQEIKDRADYVTATNEQDGVAEALQKFCF
ncbi:MAG: Cof-type HAD-IIB family hydrolase [Carboxydocellales bacterium]